jgi:hypothetical protein
MRWASIIGSNVFDAAEFPARTWLLPLLAASLFFGHATRMADGADADAVPIEVETDRFDEVREGHVTLRWQRLEIAAGYEVLDADGRVVYQGVASEAFLSGLPDGEHSFVVRGIDAEGAVVARADEPIVVVVKHWPLSQAIALFVVGLIVVLSVMIVLLRGAAERGMNVVAERSADPVTGDV